MKKQISRKAGIAVCIAVIVLGVASLVLYLGGFLTLDNSKDEESTSSVGEEVGYVPELFVSVADGPADGMKGVILEKGADFSDIQTACNSVGKIAEWGFNTVIFSKCDLTEAAQLAAAAKNHALFSVYLIESNDIVKSGTADEAAAASYGALSVDSVLINVSEGSTKNEAATAARALRNADENLYLGVFASAEKKYSPVCSADVFDYKYIDITVPTSSVDGEFSAFLSNYCDGTTKDTVFGMHTDLTGVTTDEILKQFAAVNETMGSGYAFDSYSILARNSDSMRDAIIDYMQNGIVKDYFKQLIISSPQKTVFETNQSKVSFVGTGDITKPLTVNGQVIKMIENGYFSLEQQLNPGENVFVFDHNGKQYTYKITYKIKLIDSVLPSDTVNAPGGTQLDIVAFAHKQAAVSAAINGKTIKLNKSPDYGDEIDDGSDYTYFVGYYTLPESAASDKNLGKIKVTAAYSGVTESKEGAQITVNAKVNVPSVTEPVDTTATDSSSTAQTTSAPTTTVPSVSETASSVDEGTTGPIKPPATTVPTTAKPTTAPTTAQPTTAPSKTQLFNQLTPYEYNGVSGRSKMIVVKKNYAETLPSSTTNDVSVPYYTALPQGTIEDVVSSSSYGSIKYYILASGRRVYQEDVEYISQGYNMPSNEIRTVSVSKGSDETKITFTMKWKVPFNVREKPQTFYEQTAGRPYSVKSFTAEYVDIVFYYTPKTDSAPSLNTSVIEKTQWIKNDDGSSTLRLFLKKKGGFYGIKYYYNSDGTLTFSIKERPSSSLSGKVIMLDPGHGGNDPGAIGASVINGKNVHEATINLAIANKVKSKLEALGATVILTRSASNQTSSLEQRQALCRSTNPDVYVAIHCDASESSSSVSGMTTYYYKSYSYPLAYYLSTSIVSAYKNEVYASNSSMANKVDRGTKFKGFLVTRVEECPSVLIEYGFVTNVTECNALSNDKNQNTLAQATVNGLVNYFKNS